MFEYNYEIKNYAALNFKQKFIILVNQMKLWNLLKEKNIIK